MQKAILSALSHGMSAQAAPESVGGATLLFLILALVSAAVAAWAFSQIKGFKTEITNLDTQLTDKTSELRETKTSNKKLQTSLEEKTDKLQKQKKDLASQKKKNHTAQEDFKKQREEDLKKIKTLETAQESKPAFTSLKVAAEPKAAPETKETVRKAPVEAAPQGESRSESEIVMQLREELAHGSNLREKLAARIKTDTTTLRNAREDLKELKYRVERYRRVDIMTKNQLDLVTDKLLTLGRQYYDAVSELAAAKGEVVPPKPKALREAEAAAAQQALAEAEAAAHHDMDDEPESEPRKEQPRVTLSSVDISDLDDPTPETTEESEAPVVTEVNETDPADTGVSANG